MWHTGSLSLIGSGQWYVYSSRPAPSIHKIFHAHSLLLSYFIPKPTWECITTYISNKNSKSRHFLTTGIMSQISTNVTADKLYEEAFSIKYAWEHMLPKEVFEYHNLIFCECNVPVDLQMGTILPFVASCLGPHTKGLFLTCACCLNSFWILVEASGVGKSQSRKRFITEPLEYILGNGRVQIPDFEISKFTHAGMYIFN